MQNPKISKSQAPPPGGPRFHKASILRPGDRIEARRAGGYDSDIESPSAPPLPTSGVNAKAFDLRQSEVGSGNC